MKGAAPAADPIRLARGTTFRCVQERPSPVQNTVVKWAVVTAATPDYDVESKRYASAYQVNQFAP